MYPLNNDAEKYVLTQSVKIKLFNTNVLPAISYAGVMHDLKYFLETKNMYTVENNTLHKQT